MVPPTPTPVNEISPPAPAVVERILRRPNGLRLAVTEIGDPSAPAAVLAHGAGSCSDFVRRTFGPALLAAGMRLVSYDLRGHGGSTPVRDLRALKPADHASDLAALAAEVGAVTIGGISLGAHAAAAVALAGGGHPGTSGLIFALPAWTGPPDTVAAANGNQADELERDGVPTVLGRIRRSTDTAATRWIAEELSGSWTRHDPVALSAVFRALSGAAAPTAAELAGIGLPTAVVALTSDPLHPSVVALRWADVIPRARYAEVSPADLATDRSRLGRVALSALGRARLNGRK